jgi:large subunit ribosomal protein L5
MLIATVLGLSQLYKSVIRDLLKKEFSYSNDMQIPCLEKIVLNIGCGAEAVRDTKKAKSAQQDLNSDSWTASSNN